MVEGWSEEILLSALAKKAGCNLTEKGVSIVNVAGTAFLRYAKIFHRKYEQEFNGVRIKVEKYDNDFRIFRDNSEIAENLITEKNEKKFIEWVKVNYTEMNIPVAIITDLDVKPEDEDKKENGKSKKELEIEKKKTKYNGQRVETFVSPHWTLEYCLFKSTSLNSKFQEIVKGIHSKTIWTDFAKGLTEKLNNKGLKKTEIAYKLALFLEADSNKKTPEITINLDDTAIKYLFKAIKHACGN